MEAAEKNTIELPDLIIGDKEVEEKDLSPMEILVRAARVMNPRQFELPREMQIHCPFPGTDKRWFYFFTHIVFHEYFSFA